MTTTKDSMHYNEAQFLMCLARAAYWTALVHSGGYKLSKSEIGCGQNPDGTIIFRPQTDEEKLAQALETVRAHLERAAEFAEHLPMQLLDRDAS